MSRKPAHRFVALTAAVALLGAQPAVLCGLSCLALHTPVESLAHHHHDTADAPCSGGAVRAADQIPLQIQPTAFAVPAAIGLGVAGGQVIESGPSTAAQAALHRFPDHPVPPPRA